MTKKLRVSTARQTGVEFMKHVTGNAASFKPILTAEEETLYDKYVAQFGENKHHDIASAMTRDANAVSEDMTRYVFCFIFPPS